jgi:hypothetical protein
MAYVTSKAPGAGRPTYSPSAAAAAQAISANVGVNPINTQTIAGVTYSGIDRPNLGSLEPVVIIHTAGTGAAEVIKIGDYYGAIATKLGLSPESDYSDTSGSTWQPDALASFILPGMVIRGLNYEVDVATQFVQPLIYASVDAGGTYASTRLNGRLTGSKRSTDQNLLVKTLDMASFGRPLILDQNNAVFLTVAAARTVTLTLDLEAVGNA